MGAALKACAADGTVFHRSDTRNLQPGFRGQLEACPQLEPELAGPGSLSGAADVSLAGLCRVQESSG